MTDDRMTSEKRQVVAKRARFCCEYCWSQEYYSTQSFSIEHIVPKCHGGKNSLDNLAFACQGCNSHKHTKRTGIDPATGQVTRLFHPRCDRWQDHFIWNEDFSRMIGLTDRGRATIAELQINRSGLVHLRQALYLLGKHPPTVILDDA